MKKLVALMLVAMLGAVASGCASHKQATPSPTKHGAQAKTAPKPAPERDPFTDDPLVPEPLDAEAAPLMAGGTLCPVGSSAGQPRLHASLYACGQRQPPGPTAIPEIP